MPDITFELSGGAKRLAKMNGLEPLGEKIAKIANVPYGYVKLIGKEPTGQIVTGQGELLPLPVDVVVSWKRRTYAKRVTVATMIQAFLNINLIGLDATIRFVEDGPGEFFCKRRTGLGFGPVC